MSVAELVIRYGNKRPVRTSLRQLALKGEEGKNWYGLSRKSIEKYAKEQGVPFEYVCDVLAILSPRVQVARNVALTQEYVETGKIKKGVMRSRVVALEKYEETGEFKGPKVNAFAKALKGDPEACVVDAWIFRAFGMESTHYANYVRAEKKLKRASIRLMWSVAETQAAVWVGTRDACGFSNHEPLRLK